MASASRFSQAPPFPDDVPTANMLKISLAKLHAGDQAEAERMFDACRSLGFFLLDLSGDSRGEKLVRDIDRLLDIATDVMQLGMEKKMKFRYNPPQRLFGYGFDQLSYL